MSTRQGGKSVAAARGERDLRGFNSATPGSRSLRLRSLRRVLPAEPADLLREVQENIDLEAYRVQQIGSGRISLDRRPGALEPMSSRTLEAIPPEEIEPL